MREMNSAVVWKDGSHRESRSGLVNWRRLFLEAPRVGGFPAINVPDVVKENDASVVSPVGVAACDLAVGNGTFVFAQVDESIVILTVCLVLV
jgi:hypothetical protein